MKLRPPRIKNSFQFVSLILIAAIVTVWVGLLGLFAWRQMQPQVRIDPTQPPSLSQTPVPNRPNPIPASPIPVNPSPATPVSPSPSSRATSPSGPENPQLSKTPVPPLNNTVQAKYNHLPYASAKGDLVQVGVYYERSELMVGEAANAFRQMKDAAAASGVYMDAISGYRTWEEQAGLFERQIQRHNGSLEEAARLSAPPGHSEHHTGYTLDIRDLDRKDTDLKYTMETTPTYQWLIKQGCDYGFELSFPDGNQQGVSFEPWHWRYVGSPKAKEIFAAARQRYPYPTNCP